MSRKVARDLLFKLTFELLFMLPENSVTFEYILEIATLNKTNMDFVKENYPQIVESKEKIEQIIKENLSEKFSFDRLFKIDLAILTLAVYELMISKTTPVRVIVNEAVQLAKKYSTDNSYGFINGVLANIIKAENITD